jgi:hypothetical protein
MSTTRRLAVILAADVAPSRRRGDRIGRTTSVIDAVDGSSTGT